MRRATNQSVILAATDDTTFYTQCSSPYVRDHLARLVLNFTLKASSADAVVALNGYGKVAHFEIPVDNVAPAKKFYNKLLVTERVGCLRTGTP